MSLKIPNQLTDGTVIEASDLNENFEAVADKFGSITNADIASSANIDLDKLEGKYEYIDFVTNFAYNASSGTKYRIIPLKATAGDYTLYQIDWALVGGGSSDSYTGGQFEVDVGYIDSGASNAFTSEITAQTITLSGVQGKTTASETIAADSNVKVLKVDVTSTFSGQGATAGNVYIGISMRREVQ